MSFSGILKITSVNVSTLLEFLIKIYLSYLERTNSLLPISIYNILILLIKVIFKSLKYR